MLDEGAIETTAPMRRFDRYPDYRNSAVEWLGEIPAHWDTPPLYSRYMIDLGKMLDESKITGEHLVPYVRNIDVQWDSVNINKLPEMDIRRDEYERYTLKPGDLLVCEGGEVGRAAIFKGAGTFIGFQKALHRLRPVNSSESPRFLFYTLHCASHLSVFLSEGNPNTIPHLTGEKLRRYRFPAPPLEEQHAIAAFLDRETAKIDALVAKKERLIELLEEKRAALITRAVTKGLDPNAPMKESGIEWLGKIPAHWGLQKMWSVSEAVGGGTPSKDDPRYWQGTIPWASPKDMKRCLIDSTEDTISETAVLEARLKLLSPPMILIVVRGMILAHTFPVAITTVPVTINQDMKALRIHDMLDAGFFALFLMGIGRSLLGSIVEEAAHGTRAIRMDMWRVTPAVVPPMPEQRRIVGFLESETEKIDALLERVQHGTDRLRELRTALISAAVTGKIDVRDEAA